ncbi:MAG: TldD/PmbA family protein [Candidatus Cloacimonetes bacterium]|nr:TldD/PmbA family protein [Candidatus Cloacimonadota bacterium]MCF7814726.1 TldD/PmbA family protein [Candidatus Cloacimonadota bacterium]MCF7869133.1 TldD/PmbA family protein [Candidatus Cloacimonadota bacterium]MCF7884598.1 TldD/PmbA family protein [Candidatus Cloacimonadota bacterium]
MIIKELEKYRKFFTEYTELRIQENRNTRISLVKGDVMSNNRSSEGGVSARVYKDGSWGFASDPVISDEIVKKVINTATDNAVFLSSKQQDKKSELISRKASLSKDFTTTKPKKSQKEMIEFLKEIDDHIIEKYPDLTSRAITLAALDMEKTLITSDESYSYSMIPRCLVYLVLTLVKDGKPYDLFQSYGGFGQFEDNFDDPAVLFDGIRTQYEHLVNKADGIYAKAGMHDVIMDAELAGILAHEAIGHTTESDIVKGGSVAADYMNKKAASEIVNLVDFANEAFGQICPVPVFVDDEGTLAQDAVIIKDGVLQSYMNNKDTALYFGHELTGNARAYRFNDEPLVRMRNTAILPGTCKLEDMIASIEDGYYLMKSYNGQADSTSEFMFGVQLGYEIKNGKLGKAIKDTTISGVAFDVLKSVSMVSDDMSWDCSGMCGKKQPIPVGMGGPAIKCRVNIGGK